MTTSSAIILEGQSEATTAASASQIDRARVPKHVAIIMDGNGRWAKLRGLPALAGHRQGVAALREVVEEALRWGVQTLTVYAFSTENWARSLQEVEGLFDLIGTSLCEQCDQLRDQGVGVAAIGDLAHMPIRLRERLAQTIEATRGGERLKLVLAINYGGRDDICRALKRVVGDCADGKLARESIDESLIGNYLDTAAWPDPELCIRTSGESRISNFLLWQLAYAEMVFTKALWPDFAAVDFAAALVEFQTRKRRFGLRR